MASLNQNSARFWIGITTLSGDEWKNIDDTSNTTYFNWVSEKSTNAVGSAKCISMDLTGTWYDDDCLNKYSYICGISETKINPIIQLNSLGDNNVADKS